MGYKYFPCFSLMFQHLKCFSYRFRTFLYEEERVTPGFKAAKDCLTLTLGYNAVDRVKLKSLLVYHSENPRALKGVHKSSLPVVWQSNKKAWVTRSVFHDYLTSDISPFTEM